MFRCLAAVLLGTVLVAASPARADFATAQALLDDIEKHPNGWLIYDMRSSSTTARCGPSPRTRLGAPPPCAERSVPR